MRRVHALILACAVVAAPARIALAQGEDALPVPAGTLRIGIAPYWAHWDSRFCGGGAGCPSGTRQPLGAAFSSESLGVTQLPFLAPAESALRAITGLSALSLNLGRAQLTINNSYRVIPFTVEYAPSRRFGIRVAVPIVRARVETFLAGPDSIAAHRGNVGLNPAFTAPATIADFRSQVDTALAALRYQAANGPAGMRAQALAAYNQLQPTLCGLYTLSAGSASAATSPCFIPGANASPVLPVDTTAAGDSIVARVTSAESQYSNLRAQYAGLGVDMPDLSAGYVLPTTALDTNGVRDLFSNPAGVIAGDSLTSIVRTRLGNVEVGAWYQLADGARWRSQLAFTVRLPTGTPDSPHNFVDLGTGTKALGWEVGMKNDFILRSDFWLHAGLRVAGWASSNVVRRVGPPELLILPIFDTATVHQSLGMTTMLDVVPNWQLDDAFRVGVGLHWIHTAQTHYDYVNAGDLARVGMAAGVLDAGTGGSALRLGGGVTFSTVDRYARHQASMPYDVTVAFSETFSGSGGNVPAAAAFNMQLRFYIGH